MIEQATDIIEFWYADEIKPYWFDSTPQVDAYIRSNFLSIWRAASLGELDAWRISAEGCLALAIVLDQFPLNMFRGQAMSFSTESHAIAIALHAIRNGFDRELISEHLIFLYMPLMHSENINHQNLSVALYEAAGLGENARFARHHRDIIKRFGRFPHRNAILGRVSTAEELAYLASDGAFLG